MLNFTGTGSAFNTELGNNGAYIKDGKILFLIDCGSSTFERIMRADLLDGVEYVYVLLTHTHPDHVGSLGDLIFYGYYAMGEMKEPSVTVIAPYELEIANLLKQMGVGKECYDFAESNGFSESFRISSKNFKIQIDLVPVNHVEELSCFGYILHYNDEVAYYSGDCNEIPYNIISNLHSYRFDYFYQDTCKADYHGNVHLSLRQLDELIDEEFRSSVYCMHLDNSFDIEEAKSLGFSVVNSNLV